MQIKLWIPTLGFFYLFPQAKMDNEVLAYKDLAAIPKDKAILDIERPDLMIYEPHFTYSLLDHVEKPRSREVRKGKSFIGRVERASTFNQP